MDLDCLQTKPGVGKADNNTNQPINSNNSNDDEEAKAIEMNKNDTFCPLVYRETEERILKLDSDDHLSSDQDDESNIKSNKSRRLLPLRYASHSSRDSSPSSDAVNTNNHIRSHDSRPRTISKEQRQPRARLSSILAKRRRRDLDDDDGEDDTIPVGEEDPDSERRKEELMQSQRNNKQVFDRNKRMFGMLMGTLKKFKTEETSREEVTLKRSIIDEKIVQSTRVADDDVGPTRELPRIMQEANDEADLERSEIIDKAEFKLDILGRHRNWESSHKHLASFIKTETKPKIFWLPKEHTESTEKLLKGTRDYYNLFMAERAAKCKKELDDLEKTPLKDLISVGPAGWRSSTSRNSTRSPEPHRNRYRQFRRTPPRREYRSPASDTSSDSYRRH